MAEAGSRSSMAQSLSGILLTVQSQPIEFWRDPEERHCERLMDQLLGHDGERLARRTGMSRRRLNEQRETTHAADNWLRRLVNLIVGVREIGGQSERYLPIARAIADACGVDVAERLGVVTLASISAPARICSEALRETAEAVTSLLTATENGDVSTKEAKAIEREADQAIAKLHALKTVARERSKVTKLAGRQG